MPYDGTPDGDPRGTSCRRCRLLIAEGEAKKHIHFPQDPDGVLGLSGPYHARCAQPYESFAYVLNLNPWAKH